jgi:RNA polymerase sigma-70 factor, ECF subfamily
MKKLPATGGVAVGLSAFGVTSQRKGASTPAEPLARPTEFDAPEFLARLRCGEAQAYRVLIRRFHGTLIRFATSIIGSRAQAEEVVQDAWLAVFSGIGAFEGRSSLVAWVFRIVLNRARTRITREGRLVGLPALTEGSSPGGTAGDVSESRPGGHWSEASRLCDEISPERICGGRQLWNHVTQAIDRLPSGQRAVITIWRDTEGCEAADACKLLGIAAGSQRVQLHRARNRIRQTIDAVTDTPGRRQKAPQRNLEHQRHAALGTGQRPDSSSRAFCVPIYRVIPILPGQGRREPLPLAPGSALHRRTKTHCRMCEGG